MNQRIQMVEQTINQMRQDFLDLKREVKMFRNIAYYIAGVLTINLGKLFVPGVLS